MPWSVGVFREAQDLATSINFNMTNRIGLGMPMLPFDELINKAAIPIKKAITAFQFFGEFAVRNLKWRFGKISIQLPLYWPAPVRLP